MRVCNWDSVTLEDRDHNDVNEVTLAGSETLNYDAKGNLTENDNFLFVWDIDGHLKKATDKNNSEETDFTYDALGRRVEKLTSGEDTLYVSCGQKVCEEYTKTTGAYALARTYVHGTYIDDIIAKVEADNSVVYYHTDRQYNVRGLTDENGVIVELYAYTPYGERTVMDVNETVIIGSAYDNQYGYTGRYLDNETGLWYFRARYFDTALGRFISRDPLGYVDGMGLYNGYFGEMFMMDPSGQGIGHWLITGKWDGDLAASTHQGIIDTLHRDATDSPEFSKSFKESSKQHGTATAIVTVMTVVIPLTLVSGPTILRAGRLTNVGTYRTLQRVSPYVPRILEYNRLFAVNCYRLGIASILDRSIKALPKLRAIPINTRRVLQRISSSSWGDMLNQNLSDSSMGETVSDIGSFLYRIKITIHPLVDEYYPWREKL